MISCEIKQIAYKRIQESWGGATIRHDGFMVTDKTDTYAVAVSPTVSIHENSSFATFAAAFDGVMANIECGYYIGVFHDDVKRTIDFNMVTVVNSTDEVDALYAAGNPITGGAYHFATGNGYWPQGTPSEYA
jgi:phage tail tube protein FII